MDPMDAVSATDDPDIPPKSILATMLTMARPPLILPTRMLEKSTSLLAIPDCAIICPASMKNGIAIKEKLSRTSHIFWTTTIGGILR